MKMKIAAWFLVMLMVVGVAAPVVMAEEESPAGVAGCSSIKVSPDLSLEDQQGLCNAGERDPGTSCAASGNGTCSSPKLNDTLPEADHCICVGEVAEAAPVE